MLLEDATSKEQVEQVLAGSLGHEEAEELRLDIQDQLDQTVEEIAERADWENDDFVLKDWLENNEAFVDAVITESPSEYNLSVVPRGSVEYHVNREARSRSSIFWTSRDRGLGRVLLLFSVPRTATIYVSDRYFPNNYSYIPAYEAEGFWNDLGRKLGGRKLGVEWQDATDRLHAQYGSGKAGDVDVWVSPSDFEEFCRDIISENINDIAEADPDGVRRMFRSALRGEEPVLARRFSDAGPSDDDVLDLAVRWFSGDRSEVRDEIEVWLDAVEGGTESEAAEREVVVEITEDDLRKLGLTTGTLWENRPWKLIKLEPKDLGREGTSMRHCVGSKGMKYIQAVQNGEIEIWSLRSKDNKPRFTLEVDKSFYEPEKRSFSQQDLKRLDTTPEGLHAAARGEAIKQVKGKANRLPGYADAYGRSGVVKFPEEVTLWAWIFDQLDVDGKEVEDFLAFRAITDPSAAKPPQPNTGEACVGFDVPYRPLRRP